MKGCSIVGTWILRRSRGQEAGATFSNPFNDDAKEKKHE